MMDENLENNESILACEELQELVDNESEPASNDQMEDFQLESPYFDPEKQMEVEWRDRTGLNDDTLKGAIETIIFMSDRPIPLVKIRDYIDKYIPLRVLHESLIALQNEYEEKHHGIRLLEIAQGYQFRTKASYAKYIQNYFKISSLVLTPSALEVLAIIAYKQPVSRNDIDKIRGVDSSHIVRTLMDKRLVKIQGRSEELGRPTVYGTTLEFLEVFNLPSIDQLPSEIELEEMIKKGSVGEISEIKNLVSRGDKTRFFYDELDELDKLSEQIKEIKPNTLFTSSLNIEERKRVSEDGQKAKSAFEILEEFVTVKEVLNQNTESVGSNLINEAVFPKVVEDLFVDNLNAPDEEEEEFQMIDLDTGEPINPPTESVTEQSDDFLFTPKEIETLDQRLDEVFDRLKSGEGLGQLSFEEEEEFLYDNDLDDKNEQVDRVTDNLLDRAQEYDLDLSFLKNNNEKSSLSGESLDADGV